MYTKLKIKDKVRVPPNLFSQELKTAVEAVIKQEYEGELTNSGMILILLNEIEEIGEGIIIPEDGAIYYETTFEMIAWEPMIQEVVEGLVTEVREFGLFLRIGPLDGLVHSSQLMDDYVSYDKTGLKGKQSTKIIKVGDKARARIIAISLKSKEGAKIGLTMRQPGLGKMEWVEKEFEESKK